MDLPTTMCPQAEIKYGEVASTSPPPEFGTPATLPPDCVPHDELSVSAYKLAQSNLPLSILNHSLRVYLYAKFIADYEKSSWANPDRLPLLFVACILHDIGCTPRFDGPQRFEVEGGDAAAAHLRLHGVPPGDVHEVWQAIALHTSPQIAERVSSLARLIRATVLIDFHEAGAKAGGRLFESLKDENGNIHAESIRGTIEESFPRLEPEKILGDAVVAQALKQRGKAPAASWPGIMLRAKLDEPEWEGVNKAF